MVARLRSAITAYRVGDPDGMFEIWSPDGAKRVTGRWHEVGAEVIYAGEDYSTAMLEALAHASGERPPNQRFIKITIPAGVSYEVATKDTVPGWDSSDEKAARAFGKQWYDQQRSAILFVPSYVAREGRNIVFNTRHPEFVRVTPDLETRLWWDPRLFGDAQRSLIDRVLSAFYKLFRRQSP